MDGTKPIDPAVIAEVKERWRAAWPEAREAWSPYVKLQEPIWCATTADAVREGLQGSFAMIRLNDHRIVIDLEGVVRTGVQGFPVEILAHEIGHHIYTPANLRDNAVMMGRIRWVLAQIEERAPFVANIYADMLINDRLQRQKGLRLSAVYEQVNRTVEYSELWRLIMRSFEYLWRLRRGTLAGDLGVTEKIDSDASLIAALIRSYANDWLAGAIRFTALLYPYLMDQKKFDDARKGIIILLDAEEAGLGAGIIPGLVEIDPELGAGGQEAAETGDASTGGPLPSITGGVGPRQRYLSPGIYLDYQRKVNPGLDEQQVIQRYYKEIALPHLVDFPRLENRSTSLTLPEGTEDWDVSEPMEDIDWLETAIVSPHVIPGYNTKKRTYGPEDEDQHAPQVLDIYIGVDCSGSMMNPAVRFSWPVLSATIIGLSALRAGAKVMACLSGEPGSYMETDGFVTREETVLTLLTSYLGTGYAFGVPRLNKPFRDARKTKSHIVLATDNDLFSMLNATNVKESNWVVIERALKNAGGTGTIVLHSPPNWEHDEVKRLLAMGWHLFYVTNEEEFLDFAAKFAKQNYQPPA